ncbi:MAG: hypothetical protein AAFN11_16350 [Chloroflexota bacterium]
MQDSPQQPHCTIEFRVYDEQRFDVLSRFFMSLRDYSRSLPGQSSLQADITATRRFSPVSPTDDTQETQTLAAQETRARGNFARPEEWLLALRPQDMAYLGMPDHKASIIAMREWQGLSRRERRKVIRADENKNTLRMLADFVDMLKYWQEIEFELLTLEKPDPDRAHITYKAHDYPFKGKVALEELLMFFGFLSILRDTC